MSKISEFAEKQTAFNTRQNAATEEVTTSLADLSGDLDTLNEKITELQNSQGQVTPEDQALINDLESQGEAIATKVEAVSTALKALAAQTPPKPPVE